MQVHKLVHLDTIVGDVQVGQVLKEFKILFCYITDVHTGQL